MSDLVELKPCPFCNSAPNPVPQNGDVLPGGNGYFQTIWCERCDAEGGKRKTEADAIEAWNRRSALSLPVQPVAWRWPVEGGFIYCENKDEVLVEDGSEQPLYANPVPPTKGPEELAEIERMLNEGQGDDDGMQIMPDFDEGMSTLAKVETCLHLLEKRRDVIAAYAADENWRDDPSADERWNAGLDFGMSKLCAYLGVDPAAVTWDAATETLDGDVCAVIGNILRAKYGDDWGPLSRIATKGPEDDLIAALNAAKSALIDAQEELRLIRMKDTGAVYDTVLRSLTLPSAIRQADEALALRSRPASALPEVGERIKPLEWYPDPGAFPYNTWGAQSSFGRFIIEEVSASDSPAYEARYTPHHLITIKDSLEDAKAAAQADYERRILSALTPSVQP